MIYSVKAEGFGLASRLKYMGISILSIITSNTSPLQRSFQERMPAFSQHKCKEILSLCRLICIPSMVFEKDLRLIQVSFTEPSNLRIIPCQPHMEELQCWLLHWVLCQRGGAVTLTRLLCFLLEQTGFTLSVVTCPRLIEGYCCGCRRHLVVEK